jgi:hypothetical protein
MLLKGDQLEGGSARLVVQRTVNEAPGVSVESNWKVPLPSSVGDLSANHAYAVIWQMPTCRPATCVEELG